MNNEFFEETGTEWNVFNTYLCEKLYDQQIGRLVIKLEDGSCYYVDINWKQGHDDNWFFEDDGGSIYKPDEVTHYLFDFC